MKKTYKIISILLYLVSLLILLFCIKIRFSSSTNLTIQFKIILFLLVSIFIYICGYIQIKKLNYNKKILKVHLVIYFLLYIVIIFTLTLFDEIYGRQGFKLISWNKDLLETYFKYSFNIIPFSTIKLYINGFINGIVSSKVFFNNIFGNILAFMPFSIFIPLIFKKVDKYYKLLLIMIPIIVIIELMQFITISGSCDIDDLILNILGITIMYFVSKIKPINGLINKIFYLGVENEKE